MMREEEWGVGMQLGVKKVLANFRTPCTTHVKKRPRRRQGLMWRLHGKSQSISVKKRQSI